MNYLKTHFLYNHLSKNILLIFFFLFFCSNISFADYVVVSKYLEGNKKYYSQTYDSEEMAKIMAIGMCKILDPVGKLNKNGCLIYSINENIVWDKNLQEYKKKPTKVLKKLINFKKVYLKLRFCKKSNGSSILILSNELCKNYKAKETSYEYFKKSRGDMIICYEYTKNKEIMYISSDTSFLYRNLNYIGRFWKNDNKLNGCKTIWGTLNNYIMTFPIRPEIMFCEDNSKHGGCTKFLKHWYN